MTYRLLSVAQQELADAMEYYEQASSGLGSEFLDEVERTIRRSISSSPTSRFVEGSQKSLTNIHGRSAVKPATMAMVELAREYWKPSTVFASS